MGPAAMATVRGRCDGCGRKRSLSLRSKSRQLCKTCYDASRPKVPDRVAGCLVLRYGQHLTRIARLTIDDVREHPKEPGALGLTLGSDPLWLRPRLSHLLARLIVERRPDRVLARNMPTPHLFPGAHPGQPLSADHLARRLKTLGIKNMRHARNGALLSMVGSVHWKLLADLLGISDSAAQ